MQLLQDYVIQNSKKSKKSMYFSGGMVAGEKEKDASLHHYYSFQLLQERVVLLQGPDVVVMPLHSNEPLHSNFSEILGRLNGRRTSESKLPNKR